MPNSNLDVSPYLTEAVVGLARQMLATGDYGPAPILADALEEAGYPVADDLALLRTWPNVIRDKVSPIICRVAAADGQKAYHRIDSWAGIFSRDFDEVMRIARKYRKDGSQYCLGDETPDQAFGHSAWQFWQDFQALTGIEIPEGEDRDSIFRCAC